MHAYWHATVEVAADLVENKYSWDGVPSRVISCSLYAGIQIFHELGHSGIVLQGLH